MGSRGSVRSGTSPGHRSTLRGRPTPPRPGQGRARHAAAPSPPSRTRICSRPSAPTSRARPGPETSHERHIITEAPNIMWAIDATQVTTVADGKVWLFGVAEHWNAELLGWHVAKHGTRYEAIQALGMAVRQQFGHLDAGAARGLALRHDHGSNFMADAFQKQVKFWGMAPSYAFVAEPETNGVIERLFRTLKEQAIHGRIFQTVEDVRDAVRALVARYNAEWLVEKNGYRSPAQMRAAWQEATFRH